MPMPPCSPPPPTSEDSVASTHIVRVGLGTTDGPNGVTTSKSFTATASTCNVQPFRVGGYGQSCRTEGTAIGGADFGESGLGVGYDQEFPLNQLATDGKSRKHAASGTWFNRFREGQPTTHKVGLVRISSCTLHWNANWKSRKTRPSTISTPSM